MLFSKDYGIWGPKGFKPGGNVKLSDQRLKEKFIFNETCSICVAKHNDRLVGYSIYTKFICAYRGKVVWITQLVVDSNFRGQKIAQNLIHRSLDTNWTICGLVSSHPYAIRALEKATRLKC